MWVCKEPSTNGNMGKNWFHETRIPTNITSPNNYEESKHDKKGHQYLNNTRIRVTDWMDKCLNGQHGRTMNALADGRERTTWKYEGINLTSNAVMRVMLAVMLMVRKTQDNIHDKPGNEIEQSSLFVETVGNKIGLVRRGLWKRNPQWLLSAPTWHGWWQNHKSDFQLQQQSHSRSNSWSNQHKQRKWKTKMGRGGPTNRFARPRPVTMCIGESGS